MNNNELFDYYDNIFSYVKVIMKNSKNENNLEKLVIRDIFNEVVGEMDSNKIYEMLIISSLFEKKLKELNKVEREKTINNMYSCYIKPMILNYTNNCNDMVKFFFEALNNKVLSISGFYGIFGDNQEIFYENLKKLR